MMGQGRGCDKLVRQFLEHLEAEFLVTPNGAGCVLVTPFHRPDGESIEVEVQVGEDGGLRLSDMGDSMGYLHTSGLQVTRNVLDEARRICRRSGALLQDYEVVAEDVRPQDQGGRLHSVLQAALAVTELINKRRPTDRLLFDDEVETFLIAHRAVYDHDYAVQGATLTHKIKFYVDSERRLLIQPLSATNEPVAFAWAERWAYRFGDIRRHDPSWNAYAVLDDRGERAAVWGPRVLPPLKQDATVVFWKDSAALADALGHPRR